MLLAIRHAVILGEYNCFPALKNSLLHYMGGEGIEYCSSNSNTQHHAHIPYRCQYPRSYAKIGFSNSACCPFSLRFARVPVPICSTCLCGVWAGRRGALSGFVIMFHSYDYIPLFVSLMSASSEDIFIPLDKSHIPIIISKRPLGA